jgi:Acyl-coenzyme A:6-aminopenicillanic acid acyl-transferase
MFSPTRYSATSTLCVCMSVVILFLYPAHIQGVFTPNVTNISSMKVVRSYNTSVLYSLSAPGYNDPIYVVDIKAADHYNRGVHYAHLLANESIAAFNALTHTLSKSSLVVDLLEMFLDWQFHTYAMKQLPQQFVDELSGFKDAGKAIGAPQLYSMVTRGITLASIATGWVQFDIEYLLLNEFGLYHSAAAHDMLDLSEQQQRLLADLISHGIDISVLSDMDNIPQDSARFNKATLEFARELHSALTMLSTRHCSMFGAWGSRTVEGQLFSGRNLDWLAQTGLAQYKVISVYHSTAGANTNSFATIGYAGIIGAITGMSDAGITVHEAGDDNKVESLEGFIWSLRLRYILEHVSSMSEARQLWSTTNNTLGLNHGIGSAHETGDSPRFMCLETCANYSAYFFDNDPREANMTYDGKHYGFPIEEAVWRTNHGYDPTFLKTARSSHPGTDSFVRYMLIHDTIELSGRTGTLGDLQAINITAVAGDKGGDSVEDFVSCGATSTAGSNVISATFKPAARLMYVAYENGFGADHVVAGCNNYVTLDMNKFFSN